MDSASTLPRRIFGNVIAKNLKSVISHIMYLPVWSLTRNEIQLLWGIGYVHIRGWSAYPKQLFANLKITFWKSPYFWIWETADTRYFTWSWTPHCNVRRIIIIPCKLARVHGFFHRSASEQASGWHLSIHSHGPEYSSWGLMIRHVMWYWNRSLLFMLTKLGIEFEIADEYHVM